MPQLTRFYGLRPPDIDAMTPREVSEYVEQMQRHQQEEARRDNSRG